MTRQARIPVRSAPAQQPCKPSAEDGEIDRPAGSVTVASFNDGLLSSGDFLFGLRDTQMHA